MHHAVRALRIAALGPVVIPVRRLDQPLRQPVVQGSVDGRPVFDDFAAEVHEGGNATTSGPADPGIERLFAGLALDDEDVA